MCNVRALVSAEWLILELYTMEWDDGEEEKREEWNTRAFSCEDNLEQMAKPGREKRHICLVVCLAEVVTAAGQE